MSRKYKILLLIACILLVCGFALFFSYFYFNNKMHTDILSIAENSIKPNNTSEVELETEQHKTDTSEAEYQDALTGEFADTGKDQKIKKVKDYISVLEIPQCHVLAHIYDDVSRTSLAYGVGHYPNTKGIGKKGNCVIAGHSSLIYDCILNEVKNLNIMDKFNVYDKKGKKHVYYVLNIKVVEPTDMYVLESNDDTRSEFTIITCTNAGKQRLVINSYEMSKEEIKACLREQNQAKYNLMTAKIQEIEQSIVDLDTLYTKKYLDKKANLVIHENYKNGGLVRYLITDNQLQNKHYPYSYELYDEVLKEKKL